MPRNNAGKLYIACYDVTLDSERNQISQLLQGYGFRVQYSVFELRLTRRSLVTLKQQIEKLTLSSGHLRLYLAYDAQCHCFGMVPPSPDRNFIYFV